MSNPKPPTCPFCEGDLTLTSDGPVNRITGTECENCEIEFTVKDCESDDEWVEKLMARPSITTHARIHDGLGRGDSLELIQECQRLRALVAVQDFALKAPASEIRHAFAVGFRHGCGANVSDELDLLRKLAEAWKTESAQPPLPSSPTAKEPRQTAVECSNCGAKYLYPRWIRCEICAKTPPPQPLDGDTKA